MIFRCSVDFDLCKVSRPRRLGKGNTETAPYIDTRCNSITVGEI